MAKIADNARVRIVSDGTLFGTRVEVDGEPLNGVTVADWHLDARDGIAVVRLNMHYGLIDVHGNYRRKHWTRRLSQRAQRAITGLRYAIGK